MAVKIKLKRIGKMREPHYRIVVADARTKRSGRAIEEIGQYHPQEDPSRILVDSDRVQYWLGVGAQPTEAVAAILRVTGDWQAFKGEPAPPPMLVAEPKTDKRAAFEAAAKEAAGVENAPAATPKRAKKAPAKAEQPKAEQPKAEEPKAEEPKAEEPKAEESKAEESKAEEPKAEEPKAEEPKAEAAAEPAAETGAEDTPATGDAEPGES